jgi:PAS domain S-box-containing protein
MNQTTTHILIVEDEAAHAELIRRAFDTEAEWASSVIVGTLREAQEYVTASMPDLMIVDLLLPDGNGTELLPGDREEAACPIVVMTSHGDEQVAVEAMKAGALDYVVKSETTLAALPRTVKRVLREWNYLIERKQAEEALQASEEKYHSLFTSMLSGFAYHKIITDKQGHPEDYVFLEVNDAFESLTGLKKENIVGKKLTEAIPEIKDEAVDWIERYGQVALTGKEIKFEQYSEALNRWYSVSAYSPRKGYFAVVFDDITERKQLEEQLRQSQKMEAVGHMAGGMAHHFNNFLTVITGNVGLALADLPPSHPLAHDLQRIQRAAQRAADLTQQLLAFTRLQIAQLMVLDLNNLVVETSSTLRQLISEAIELAVLPGPELAQVKVDPSQFEQVLVNLVLNARDAMPKGGKLTVEIANVILDQAYIDQHAAEIRPGLYVMLVVTDTGIGMTEEVKAHVFEPFFTTKEVGQGTGLGLSTCYGIVEQHKGHISVESEPGQGTTFSIYLPRVEETPSHLAIEGKASINLTRGTETILLVEDEALVREIAGRVLRQQGYTVLEAINGEDALRMVEKKSEKTIDLLVTDLVMPRLGGDILAERLRAILPSLKVLFISGYPDGIDDHHRAMKSTIPFLPKPFNPAGLARKVREILDTPPGA